MPGNNSQKKQLIPVYGLESIMEEEQGSKGQARSQCRKLRAQALNSLQDAESKLDVGKVFYSQIPSLVTHFLQQGHTSKASPLKVPPIRDQDC